MSNFTPSFRLICIALYFLLIPFTLTAQFSRNKLKALPGNPPELDRKAVPWLPFEEDWNSGLFETNHWLPEGNGYDNWRISGQVGNEAPSVEFYYSPYVTNYQESLTSRLLNARNLIDGKIILSFDLKLTLLNPTGMEFMRVQVLTDSVWINVWADSNMMSCDWVNKKLDITEPVKGNTFRFRFLAEGQNSLDIFNWLIDNISVYRECAPPLNLTASVNFPSIYEVILEWDPPTGPIGNSVWIEWDNGINDDAIGLTDGGTFGAAVRFTPAQLAQYNGNYLTRIRFFPYAEGSFVLKVWTGANAGQLVLSQPVDSIVIGLWNEVELATPVYVSGTTELWFGYTVTHTSGNSPAGIDIGPAVAGFGDMISLDGNVWESMATAYALNYNWNLQGFVQPIDDTKKKVLMSHRADSENNYKEKSGNGKSQSMPTYLLYPETSSGNRDLIRYDIYDSYYYPAIYVGSTTETTYIFQPENYPGGFCFFVSAVYTDCEAFSDEYCLFIPSLDKHSKLFKLYPVPADQNLTIEINSDLVSFNITDFYYRTVYQADKIKAGSLTINTSFYPDGIYLIKATDVAGNISAGKFVVNH